MQLCVRSSKENFKKILYKNFEKVKSCCLGLCKFHKLNHSKFSRGQMKIQQMAFVLIAIMLFFAMVGIVYFTIRTANLRESAGVLREQEAKEIVRKIASTPEFMMSGCSNCIDLDKLLEMKGRSEYAEFWGLNYLAVSLIYPEKEGECTKSTYPNCGKITLIEAAEEIGIPAGAFVSLCRWEQFQGEGYTKCEIGKIFASGESI